MRVEETPDGWLLYKENKPIGRCAVRPLEQGVLLAQLCVAPAWRRKGYGSYLLKEVLRRYGGYERERASVFFAPLPQTEGERAFWAKFGFCAEGGRLARRRTPDLSAVRFAQEFLRARLSAPAFCVDATCGNGGDTAFLCRLTAPGGRVLAMDVQPQALERTRARLAAEGVPAARVQLVCDSHEHLLRYAAPGSADAVMFNFGWLPGGEHTVYSTAQSSLPALEAVLAWLRALPLKDFTVLVCDFANWAQTAPLPCFVLKK